MVLNRISLSNNNDDDGCNDSDVVGDGGGDGIIVVLNVVSFCKLNQMSVKRMPIIKPIIKQKIFLQTDEHKEHFIRDVDSVDVVAEELSGNVKAQQVVSWVDCLCSLNVLKFNIFLPLISYAPHHHHFIINF